MPSALKKLKSDLHTRRTSKSKPKSNFQQPPQKLSKASKSISTPFRRETPAQRAYRLRTETLLPELQRRNKAGGITDRRIGENDPTLAPEDRMLQRYAAEGQRKRKADVFNLEDDESGEEEKLTHMGRPLNEGNRLERLGRMKEGMEREEEDKEDVDGGGLFAKSKRKLEDAIDEVTRAQEDEGENGQPPRKKTRNEIMKEVIAKSKFHKHERQATKEDYDDKREELDKQMPDLLALLGGSRRKTVNATPNTANDMTGAQTNGVPVQNGEVKGDANKEYDQRVRQMMQEQRAKPTTRTKTEEEKAEEHAAHLKRLEENRQRRMRGEQEFHSDESSESEEKSEEDEAIENGIEEEQDADEAAEFGFEAAKSAKPDLDVEDEDDFMIDEDLIASGSDVEVDLSDEDSQSDNTFNASNEDNKDGSAGYEDDADFLKDVLPTTQPSQQGSTQPSQSIGSLAYTYTCPQTHAELLEVFSPIAYQDVPTVIQRIRALYHPSLAEGNKDKLAAFACGLVDHLPHLTKARPTPPLDAIEQVTRHIHSMSRTQPLPIGHEFRKHLQRMHEAASESRPGDGSWLGPGDLTILTAIGSIYPTSDHFHQVVTPAITLMARWLGTTTPPTPQHLTTSRLGAYLVALVVRYQHLSRRYVPETVRFSNGVLEKIVEAITKNSNNLGEPAVKVATQHIDNLTSLMDLWSSTSAFIDIFSPRTASVLSRLAKPNSPLAPTAAKAASVKLQHQLAQAQLARRTLELHHHPPRAIRTAIPLFDEHFNPTKHYDPDTTRSETNKLRKEHKQEKKAAMRELRRDAEFVARTKLVERKEKDRAYEEKFRRIIGGIEREEGEGKNKYEREREERRRSKKR